MASTFIRWAYRRGITTADTSEYVNVDGRGPVRVAGLMVDGVITVNELDRGLVTELDRFWALERIGTTDTGPSTTFAEPVYAVLTDPVEGDSLTMDENGVWRNVAGARVVVTGSSDPDPDPDDFREGDVWVKVD